MDQRDYLLLRKPSPLGLDIQHVYDLLNTSQADKAIEILTEESSSEKHFHLLGKAYEQKMLWSKAVEAFSEAIERSEKFALSSRRRRTECAMRLDRWNDALSDAHFVYYNADDLNIRDCKRLSMSLGALSKYGDASKVISHFSNRWIEKHRQALASGPVILTAALPKSGSTSLSYALSVASGFPKINFLCLPSNSKFGGFGLGVPSANALKNFKGIGAVNHCHLEPKNKVFQLLEQYPWVKVVLHMRNPVDVLISTLDMARRIHSPWIVRVDPDIVTLPLSRQIDWMIDNYLPYQISWIKRWWEAYEQGNSSIIAVTRFEDFLTLGQDKVARNVCHSMGLKKVFKVATPSQRTGIRELQKRGGMTDEQYSTIMKKIPARLIVEFGWS